MVDPDPGSVGSRTFWSNRFPNNLSGSGSVSEGAFFILYICTGTVYANYCIHKCERKDSSLIKYIRYRSVLWIRIRDPDPYWIRIQLGLWIRIRIRNPDPDPDPGGQK